MYSNFPGRLPCFLEMQHTCSQQPAGKSQACFSSKGPERRPALRNICVLNSLPRSNNVRLTTILSTGSNCFQRGPLTNLHHDFSNTFWVYGLYWLAAVHFCSVIIDWCVQKLEASQLSTGTLDRAFSRKCLHRSWFQNNGEGQTNNNVFLSYHISCCFRQTDIELSWMTECQSEVFSAIRLQ